jgi:hypothetical protein
MCVFCSCRLLKSKANKLMREGNSLIFSLIVFSFYFFCLIIKITKRIRLKAKVSIFTVPANGGAPSGHN